MGIPNIPNEGFDKNKGTIPQSKSEIDKLKSSQEKVNKKDEALKPANYQTSKQETLRKTILLGELARTNAANDKIIDVNAAYIGQFNTYTGVIQTDVNGNPMCVKLIDSTRSLYPSIWWDVVNKCWYAFAVYAD